MCVLKEVRTVRTLFKVKIQNLPEMEFMEYKIITFKNSEIAFYFAPPKFQFWSMQAASHRERIDH